MSVDKLIDLVGARQERDSAIDWSKLEEALATPLPPDYKMWVDRVGPGCLAGFVWVLIPRYFNKWLNLEATAKEFSAAYSELRRQNPKSYLERVFPEAGGLLPWARTDNGNYLLWRTSGKVDCWSVVVLDSRGPEIEEFSTGAIQFLLDYFKGQIHTNLLPVDLGELRFDPEVANPTKPGSE